MVIYYVIPNIFWTLKDYTRGLCNAANSSTITHLDSNHTIMAATSLCFNTNLLKGIDTSLESSLGNQYSTLNTENDVEKMENTYDYQYSFTTSHRWLGRNYMHNFTEVHRSLFTPVSWYGTIQNSVKHPIHIWGIEGYMWKCADGRWWFTKVLCR